MRKSIIRILSVTIMILCLASAGVTASAKTAVACDYTLDSSTGKKIAIPLTHECTGVISFISGYNPEGGEKGTLKKPQDIFIDTNNNIYIADTDNNTVLKLDASGALKTVITEADGLSLSKPLGVFVDADGDIFIADNGNKRILHTDNNGEFIEKFVAPETELLSQNLAVFDPAKIAVNSYNGYMYMIIGKEFLTLDAANRFKGLVGTAPVGFDLIDMLVRKFATNKQKEKLTRREPLPYNNFCISSDNRIYAVSNAHSSQIKQINSIGENTYPDGFYGEMSYDDKTAVYPLFSDIAVDSYGIITVAEQHSSKLYQYDSEGNLLSVFGGKGDSKGRYQTISSVAYDASDRLYVLDSSNNTVQILKSTSFLTQVHKALSQFSCGKYEESYDSWNSISQYVSAYPLAQKKISEILVKQEKYSDAMAHYRASGDNTGYAKAWEKVREDIYARHFLAIVIIAAAAVAAIIFLLIIINRSGLETEKAFYEQTPSLRKEFFGLSVMMIFHPVRAYTLLKRTRNRKSPYPIVVLPVAFLAVKILSEVFISFQAATRSVEKISLPMELMTSLVPLALLGLCLYGITSVFSGEMNLYETFSSISYSLVPAIVFLPLLTAVSYVSAYNELEIFHFAVTAVYIWVGINILLAVYHLNDIRLKATLGYTALSIVGVAVVVILVLLFIVFAAQMQHFFISVFDEIKGRIY